MAHTNKLLAGWSNTVWISSRIKRVVPDTTRMPPHRKLIAVIEDDDSVRKALERQISAAGYRSHAFACAEDFLKVAGLCGAAGIVCDIHLGGMSGLELALHPAVTSMNLPMVLISGCCDPSVEEPARVIASVFLRKPIAPGKLLEAIVDTVGPPIAEGEY
jgi:FixJ family two-component response regulator